MAELIEETGFVDDWHGWGKSCTLRNFPGFLGFGTRERGEDWKMGGNHFYDKNQAVAWKPMCIMRRGLMRSPYLIECNFNRYFI